MIKWLLLIVSNLTVDNIPNNGNMATGMRDVMAKGNTASDKNRFMNPMTKMYGIGQTV